MTTPYPLGRRVEHDPRSFAFALPVLPKAAISSKSWIRRVPVFDQGSLGSCTGNAAAGWIGTDNAVRTGRTVTPINSPGVVSVPVDEALAVQIYSVGTSLDEFSGEYPPDDTGSSGVGVSKALVKLGLISKYTHAFSYDAMRAALQNGPVLWGTVWYNSMFETDADGFLIVDPKSGEAGGHELCVSGLQVGTSGDVLGGYNSWGDGWGINGYFKVRSSDMVYLLSQDGDVTQPVTVPPLVISNQAHLDATLAWARGKGLTWTGYTP
jgi:hypothetical protein